MKVEFGVNPNCSELVIRLGNWDFEDAKAHLAEYGFEEAWIKDFYELDKRTKDGDWDANANTEKLTLIKDLPKDVVRLMRRANHHDEVIAGDAKKKLKKLGYTDNWYDFDLVETGKTPDYENGSTVSIREEFDGDGTTIVGHQHCQVQLYPTIHKISNIFHADVEGYDGGSSLMYEAWVDEGCPDTKTWSYEE